MSKNSCINLKTVAARRNRHYKRNQILSVWTHEIEIPRAVFQKNNPKIATNANEGPSRERGGYKYIRIGRVWDGATATHDEEGLVTSASDCYPHTEQFMKVINVLWTGIYYEDDREGDPF
jgi:hypothetical protein